MRSDRRNASTPDSFTPLVSLARYRGALGPPWWARTNLARRLGPGSFRARTNRASTPSEGAGPKERAPSKLTRTPSLARSSVGGWWLGPSPVRPRFAWTNLTRPSLARSLVLCSDQSRSLGPIERVPSLRESRPLISRVPSLALASTPS
jgi:hypothetical protein